MSKIRRVLSLVLVFMLCVVPMSAFAAENSREMPPFPVDRVTIYGQLVKTHNGNTSADEWFIKDDDGKQHNIVAYFPGMASAFKKYEGVRVKLRGTQRWGDNLINAMEMEVFDNYPTGTCVMSATLGFAYDVRDKCVKFEITSAFDNTKYTIDNRSKVLNVLLIGKDMVLDGAFNPHPVYTVEKLY